MITVNTHEAKTRLSALLANIEENGETYIICRSGKPVAELRAATPYGEADKARVRRKPVAELRAATPHTAQKFDRLKMNPRLAGQILYDPIEGATEDEWPEECR